MCCSPILEEYEIEKAILEGLFKDCEECGETLYKVDGYWVPQGCTYSPIDCEVCGSAPCDSSC